MLEANRLAEAGRVVLASTVWVYGACTGDVVDEDSPFDPNTDRHIYVTHKIASEMACRDYHTLYQRPFTVLRYGIPYGPRMRETTVMSAFFRRALAGEALTIDGDGKQSRNFVFVEDLARAHVLALGPQAENETFNLDGPGPVSIRQLAELTAELVGDVEVSLRPVTTRRPQGPGRPQRQVARRARLDPAGRGRRGPPPQLRVVRRQPRHRGGTPVRRQRREVTRA